MLDFFPFVVAFKRKLLFFFLPLFVPFCYFSFIFFVQIRFPSVFLPFFRFLCCDHDKLFLSLSIHSPNYPAQMPRYSRLFSFFGVRITSISQPLLFSSHLNSTFTNFICVYVFCSFCCHIFRRTENVKFRYSAKEHKNIYTKCGNKNNGNLLIAIFFLSLSYFALVIYASRIWKRQHSIVQYARSPPEQKSTLQKV